MTRLLVLMAAGMILPAQISTRAGLVSYVDGEVWLDGARLRRFAPMVRVAAGHTFESRGETFAELLLQTENYLRIAANTTVVMKSDEQASVEAELRGAAILDLAVVDKNRRVAVACGSATVVFAKPGIYRLDCGPASSTLRVFRGRATVVAENRAEVEGGQTARWDARVAIGRAGTKAQDQFETWSRRRSQEVAQKTPHTKPPEALPDPRVTIIPGASGPPPN